MELKKLSREELTAYFGVTFRLGLTPEQKEREKEVNDLFDALIFQFSIREYALFERVYGKTPRAYKKLSHFLRNVSECPAEVIAEAERLIAGHYDRDRQNGEANAA